MGVKNRELEYKQVLGFFMQLVKLYSKNSHKKCFTMLSGMKWSKIGKELKRERIRFIQQLQTFYQTWFHFSKIINWVLCLPVANMSEVHFKLFPEFHFIRKTQQLSVMLGCCRWITICRLCLGSIKKKEIKKPLRSKYFFTWI